jgi:hypothetical protein
MRSEQDLVSIPAATSPPKTAKTVKDSGHPYAGFQSLPRHLLRKPNQAYRNGQNNGGFVSIPAATSPPKTATFYGSFLHRGSSRFNPCRDISSENTHPRHTKGGQACTRSIPKFQSLPRHLLRKPPSSPRSRRTWSSFQSLPRHLLRKLLAGPGGLLVLLSFNPCRDISSENVCVAGLEAGAVRREQQDVSIPAATSPPKTDAISSRSAHASGRSFQSLPRHLLRKPCGERRRAAYHPLWQIDRFATSSWAPRILAGTVPSIAATSAATSAIPRSGARSPMPESANGRGKRAPPRISQERVSGRDPRRSIAAFRRRNRRPSIASRQSSAHAQCTGSTVSDTGPSSVSTLPAQPSHRR